MRGRFRQRGGGRRSLRSVRCSCRHCGTHVMGDLGAATLGGYCPVCGSYELSAMPTAQAMQERATCLS